MPNNIVILIDLNSLPPFKGTVQPDEAAAFTEPSDVNCSTATFETNVSLFETSKSDLSENAFEFIMKNVKWIQEFVLTVLSQEATNCDKLDFTECFWSYSFYNSAKDFPSKHGKRFHDLDLQSFETFEEHLKEEVTGVYCRNEIQDDVNRMSYLCSVIKNMIGGDLPWTEPRVQTEDPNTSKTKPGRNSRNSVYVMARVPRTEEECLSFVEDASAATSSQRFMNTLLPRAFFKEFHNRLRIQMNLIDMKYMHEDSNNQFKQPWDGSYASPIGKVLHYLNGGRILPMTKIDFLSPVLGLPPYLSLLKMLLKCKASTPVSGKKGIKPGNHSKISPLTETSHPRSIQSESVCSHRVSAGHSHSQTNSSGNRGGFAKVTTAPLVKILPIDGGCDRYGQYSAHSTKINRNSNLVNVRMEMLSAASEEEDPFLMEYESDARGKQIQKAQPNELSSRKYNGRIPDMNMTIIRRRLKTPTTAWATEEKFFQSAPGKLGPPQQARVQPISRSRALLTHVKHTGPSKIDYVEKVLRRNRLALSTDAEKIQSRLREVNLKAIKSRFQQIMQKVNLNPNVADEEIIRTFQLQTNIFRDMILVEDPNNVCLVSLAQALVNVLTIKLREFICLQNPKNALEDIVFVPYETLNADILERKGSATAAFIFLKCELQILLKFEVAWMFPGDKEETKDLRDDVLQMLNLISAYRRDPPIRNFMVDTLMDAYLGGQGPLVTAVFQGMGVPLTQKMLLLMSPSANEYPDDESQISSNGSSLSQVESAGATLVQSINIQSASIKPSFRNASYLSLGNSKRPIMIQAPRLSKAHTGKSDSGRKKLSLSVCRASPKRVRRNLFDVQKNDRGDIKTLISMAATSRFARSPSVKYRPSSSLKSRSPRSPAVIRGSRSKRRLKLDDSLEMPDEIYQGSPEMFSSNAVLCPESPAVHSPFYKRKKMSTCAASSEKNVIMESPELVKTKYGKRPLKRVDSLSFYSTKSNSQKSIAWEKSGDKMMAARIKDSVDLSQSLLLNDLEFFEESASPERQSLLRYGGAEKTDNSSLGIGLVDSPLNHSYNFALTNRSSEEPCCSKSILSSPLIQYEVSPNNVNLNIEALIKSENFPPSSVITNQRRHSLPHSFSCTKMLETPSKKVQFNLSDQLISTPSPARNMSATPKSILK